MPLTFTQQINVFFFMTNGMGGEKSSFYSENNTTFSNVKTLAILLLYLNY